jgi:hypothetical protein
MCGSNKQIKEKHLTKEQEGKKKKRRLKSKQETTLQNAKHTMGTPKRKKWGGGKAT